MNREIRSICWMTGTSPCSRLSPSFPSSPWLNAVFTRLRNVYGFIVQLYISTIGHATVSVVQSSNLVQCKFTVGDTGKGLGH